MIYDWKSFADKEYYYNKNTGKVVAIVTKQALHDVFISLVYTGIDTFTLDDEKHLGQYISLAHARRAAEIYWEIDSRTLIEQ